MKNEVKEILDFIQIPNRAQQVTIQNQPMAIKEYRGQRVVTFADVERVHKRPEGTAKRNFHENRSRFVETEDYFEITRKDVGADFVPTYGFDKKAPKGILLTESGYLLLVKSFTDDLAWNVQRELVTTYFKVKGGGTSQEDYKQRSLAVREMNARSRNAQLYVKFAQITKNTMCREAIIARGVNLLDGTEFLPLPQLPQRTYSAEEIARKLDITKKRVGMLANANGLKTEEFGGWFSDFVPQKGEVQTFRYYESAIEEFKSLLGSEVVA